MAEPFQIATVRALAVHLSGFRYRFSSEEELQAGVATALVAACATIEREHQLRSARDRIDFFLPLLGVGVEVKTGGAPAAVLAQLQRYAQSSAVAALILVTSRATHAELPAVVGARAVPLFIVKASSAA